MTHPTMPNQVLTNVIVEPQDVPVGIGAVVEQSADVDREVFWHEFVGVNFQHPTAGACLLRSGAA